MSRILDSPVLFDGAQLTPTLVQLGLAIGILRPAADGVANAYELNAAWFQNPLSATGNHLSGNGAHIAALFSALLGEVSASALGMPAQDLGAMGVWYPIPHPGTLLATGFYMVNYPQDADLRDGDQIFGIGILHQWDFTADGAVAGVSKIDVRVWGLLPVLKIGAGGMSLILGQQNYPLNMGVEFAGADKASIIDTNGFSFNGVKFSALLDLLGNPKVDLSVVILQLQLPTESAPSDRNLSQLEQISPQGWLSTVAALFVSALEQVLGQDSRASNLLPIFGLSPVVPDSAVRLPLLGWDKLLTQARAGAPLSTPFVNWFNSLLAQEGAFPAWMGAIGALLGVAAPAVSGSGSMADPYLSPLFSDASYGNLSLTMVTRVDEAGVRYLLPGLNFTGAGKQLGSAPAQMLMQAQLDLAQFSLATTGQVGVSTSLLNLNMGIALANTVAGRPLFEGKVGAAQYVFGSVTAGIAVFQSPTLALKVVPAFQLTGVHTPTGQYATIDLTQPGQLVDQVLDELYKLVDAAFAAVFGLNGGASCGHQAAILLGVIAPDVGAPLKWPSTLPPPFSASQLVSTFQNPVIALGDYYQSLVQQSNAIGGQLPIYYLLQAAAGLFNSATDGGVSVAGVGKATDPWLFGLSTGELPASLLAYVEGDDGAARNLTLGLQLAPRISFGSAIELDATINVHALRLELPAIAADAALQACIFPGIAVELSLPQRFTTPTVAGAAVAIDGASFSGCWSPYSSWHWDMTVGQPAVIVDGTRLPVGESMVFSDSDALAQLVSKQAATFAPIVQAMIGVAVYRTGNRPGLALNAVLGLLPNLAAFVPEGLTWPGHMPVLNPTGFSDPLGDVRRQLTALLADPDHARAALALLGWSVTADGAVPAVAGQGVPAAPWSVPVGLPGGFDLAVWTGGAGETLGLGLKRSFAYSASAISAQTELLLRCVEIPLTGTAPQDASLPSFTLGTVVTPRTPLPLVACGVGSASLLSLQLGLEVSVVDGGLVLQPRVSLSIDAGAGAQTYDLQQVQTQSSQWVASFYAMLNFGMDQLITPLLANSAVNNVYRVLALMNLVRPVNQSNTAAAVDAAGWTAMLAAPLDFFRVRGIALFADDDTRAQAVALLQAITGITLPAVPPALLQIFNALGLLKDQDEGYAPCVYDWVDLLAHPARQLQDRFAALIGDPDKLAALVDQLSLQREPVVLGPLKLTLSQGALFRLSLIDPVMLGDLLQINGDLSADLRTHQLAANVSLYCAAVQIDTRAGLTVAVTDSVHAALDVGLHWGDGSQPMPQALTLYPFDRQVFLEQVTALAPSFALATFFTQVVDARLLNQYQLARTGMSALGLAFEDPATRLWHTKSPLGLFDDPVAWLLGDAVLGAHGHLNVAALGRVLATITSTSVAPNGVGVMPIANGLRIFGLPYSQQIDLVADVDAQTFSITPGLPEKTSLPLAAGVALEAFSFSLSLGPNFQPGLAGAVSLSGKLSADTTLLLNGGYRQGFLLSAGQVESGQTFQVLPFPGWQTLVLQAMQQTAQALLNTLTGVLLDQLALAGAEQFVANLRSAGNDLQVPRLVTELIAKTGQGADAVGEAALAWLTGLLSVANAPASVGAAVTLLSPYFSGIKSDAGLLSYQPSASLPVTLVTGLQTLSGVLQVGLWVELKLPAGDSIVLAIAPTGVGIPVTADGTPVSGFSPQLNFQLSVLAPLQDDCGPKLAMRFSVADARFVLGVDPAGSALANSDYYRELLPTFLGEPDSSKWGAAVLSWLEAILLNIVPRYVSILVLNQASVKQWMSEPLFPNRSGPSASQILLASQLVVQQNSLYLLNSFSALARLTLEQFIAGFFRALLAQEFQLISIGKSGGIWLGPRDGMPDYFGIRVMVPDMELAAVPYVTFQLGDEATDWIKNAGGDASLKGGVSLYVPISTSAPDFSKLLLELVNIGLDFHGAENQRLVQMSRFSIKSVQPRGLITFDFDKSSPVQSFGGGIILSDISISLAPNAAVGGGKVNPVAQNLLGSGSASSPQANNAATNPGFSVQAAYVNNLYVDLFSADGSSQTEMWFDVQRSFGPLYANKIGVGWEQSDYLLGVLFDGSVTMAGLYIGLDTLSIGLPVRTPLDYSAYTLDLAGIDVSFSGGSVEIAGGFLKLDNPLQYNGNVTVKMAKFGLMAVGSYALVPVDPDKPDGEKAASLFIFVNLNIPLGPDPAFFINGIALGFAYNRNLKIPEPSEISQFPLVMGTVDSSKFGGDDPNKALAVLSDVVFPEIGQYWVAGGISFSTYQLLNSFALLIVRFGREFAIDLIGISSASFPPNVKPQDALAYVELALLVSFHPDAGVISLRAQLTPNSFVLSKDCQLTGGFAATVWYKGEHAGDFVITLGGYNPAFSVPDYYPVVPRLGFNWPMDIGIGSLNINGGAYFALTPSAMMAGGYLNVLFETGPLRAWFNAGVDFLIQWQPFYFLMNGHVSVGAGFETEIAGVKLSLTVQIGARLILWGPPIAGEVSVDWYVISFTIPFGDTGQVKPATLPLEWDAFQQSFLPPVDSDHSKSTVGLEKRSHPQLLMLGAAAPTPLSQAYAVLKMQASQGLIEDYPGLGWIVQTPFALNLTTVIPATTLQFTGSKTSFSGPAIGIAPMAQPSVSSTLTVTLRGWDTQTKTWVPVNLDDRKIQLGVTPTGAPEALWSKAAFDPNGVPEAKTIPDSLLGAALQGSQVLLYAPVGPMALLTLKYVTLGPLPLPFAWTPQYPAQAAGSQSRRAQVIADTIMDPLTVVPLRGAIYAALRAFGQPPMETPDLSVLQNNVTNIYQSPPSLAPLGMDLLPLGTSRAARIIIQAPVKTVRAAAVPVTQSRVIGTSRSYRSGAARQGLGKAATALPVMRQRIRATWVDGAAPTAAPAAALGAAAPAIDLRLTPGSTSIIRLGSHAPRRLKISGDLSVRVCAFNQYQEPLQQRVADLNAPEHALPELTHEVVAITEQPDDGQWAGWYHDSQWTRLNYYYFQGDGCLVRPQAPPSAPLKLNSRLKPRKRGRFDCSVVLASNQLTTAGGGLAPGWMETLFLEKVATVAVLVTGSVPAAVQWCWTDNMAMPAYPADAQPLTAWRIGDMQVSLYAVPAGADEHQNLAVLVRPGPDTILRGVLGVAGEVSGEPDLAGVMRCSAAPLAGTAAPPPSCQIQAG